MYALICLLLNFLISNLYTARAECNIITLSMNPISCLFAREGTGTGKTTTAASIAFGFVHQCRSLSPRCKVLATAFSNAGADNLAERFLELGLRVVRVGRPSGVSEALWDITLDAAVRRDPDARRAMEDAARIAARVGGKGRGGGTAGSSSRRTNKGSLSAERAKRDAATDAVKASIQVRNSFSRPLRQIVDTTCARSTHGRPIPLRTKSNLLRRRATSPPPGPSARRT